MATTIQRITTEYLDTEDRIRLVCEVLDAPVLALWLTRRLLERLVPVLCNALQGQSTDDAYADTRQTFAQQAALSAMHAQDAVAAAQVGASWVVHAVDIGQATTAVSLKFRGVGDQAATLHMDFTQLRQWLNIMHGTCAKAQWTMAVWPEWVSGTACVNTSPAAIWH